MSRAKMITLAKSSLLSTTMLLSLTAGGLSAQDQDVQDPNLVPLTTQMLGTTEGWLESGAQAIADRLARQNNTNRAKNVILFVGDGMGISTITAARILEGQRNGNPGEENYLSFEKFPHTALIKTYNVDAQVADSAGTATALNTGVKTRIGVINTGPEQVQSTCKDLAENTLTPIAVYAEQAGMSTGVVTTTRLTHATPAAVYAVSPMRNWEADGDLPAEGTEGCVDIAQQILGNLGGDGLEVALGGGRRNFQPEESKGGRRKDGRDLTQEWASSNIGAVYVETREDLNNIDINSTRKVLGLFDD